MALLTPRSGGALFAVTSLLCALLLMTGAASQTPATTTSVLYCPIAAYELGFPSRAYLPRGFLTAEHAQQDAESLIVTRAAALPQVVVQVVDSFGAVERDIGATQVRIRAVGVSVATGSVDSNIVLSGVTASVNAGEALFDQLQVERGPSQGNFFRIRFTAEVLDFSDIAVGGRYIVSGPLFLEPSTRDGAVIGFYPPLAQIITYEGEPIRAAVSGQALPTIAVAVLDSAHNVQNARSLLGAETNYTIVARFANSSNVQIAPGVTFSLRSGTTSARANRGIAQFSGLIVDTDAPEGTVLPPIEFALYNSLTVRPVRTGAVTVSEYHENHFIAFESQETSLLYYDAQVSTGLTATVFPAIRIGLRNSLMRASPTSTGLVITATLLSESATLAGAVVGVVDGVATFDQLRIDRALHVDFRPYVVVFTAGNQGGARAAGHQLRVVFLMSTEVVQSYSMRFRQTAAYSFFTRRGQEAQVTNNQLGLPVGIEVLDSNNRLSDNSTFSVTVEAVVFNSVEGEQQLSAVSVIGGRATFPPLTLPASDAVGATVQMVFRASSPDGNVGGDELQTGALTLSGEVRLFDLVFADGGVSIVSSRGESTFATVGVALPPVVLQIQTSAGAVDAQAEGITITATVDGGARLSGAFVRTAHGVATFSSLTIVSETGGSFRITFTAAATASGPVAGKTITTGAITVVESSTLSFRPRFVASRSYFEYAGHVLPVTLGEATPLPPVVVALVSSSHVFPNSSFGVTSPLLQMRMEIQGGTLAPNGTTTLFRPIVDDVAVFDGVAIREGAAPNLEFCVVSLTPEGSSLPSVGTCVSSGAMAVETDRLPVAAIAIVDEPARFTIRGYNQALTIGRGSSFSARVVAIDSTGYRAADTRPLSQFATVLVSSNYALFGETTQEVNLTSGEATFGGLTFAEDVPQGVTPFLTFTLVISGGISNTLIRPVRSGLITVRNPVSLVAGVDVVVEVLSDFATFDLSTWTANVARLLNIEPERITPIYTYTGKSGVDDATYDPVQQNYLEATWEGVRLEIRFGGPLPTSRDTRTAEDIATFFAALQPSCLLGELSIRRARLKRADESCDWFVYDSQISGVRACIQARGKPGFCDCHVPLFTSFAYRCLGLERLAELCNDVLLSSADCQQPVIQETCKLFEFPDLPRAGLMISGMVMFVFIPPLANAIRKDWFARLGRPHGSHIQLQQGDAGELQEGTFL